MSARLLSECHAQFQVTALLFKLSAILTQFALFGESFLTHRSGNPIDLRFFNDKSGAFNYSAQW